MRRLLLLGALAAVPLSGCGASAGASRDGIEVSSRQHIRHNAIVRVRTRERVVALTFDDGPDPRYTPTVLRLLARAHAHVTFFDVGKRAMSAPQLVRAELRAGHEVANHTYNHRLLTVLSDSRVVAELLIGIRALENAGAPRPTLFRAPFGGFDERIGTMAARTGERMIGWDSGLEHELNGHPIERAVHHLVGGLRRGSIIVAHDAGPLDRRRTMQALPPLLDELRRHGWRIVPVGQLLALADPRG